MRHFLSLQSLRFVTLAGLAVLWLLLLQVTGFDTIVVSLGLLVALSVVR